MATAEQIKSLIKSHLEQDEDRFLSVSIQVAAHEARQGHGRLAEEIRALVDEAKARPATDPAVKPIPIATPRGELNGLLSVSFPKTRLSDMVLDGAVRERLSRVLREQRGSEKLEAFGLAPRRKLLLVGPPGAGKTMTASALAGELKLPLYVIQIHALITKFLGETAAKLRLIFDALSQHRGVYLFDEFDAIGGERGAPNEVGEIRRVLSSFLQFLEEYGSSSLVIAATNHPQLLDRALFRRFDDVVRYGYPSELQVREAMENRLAAFDHTSVRWTHVAPQAEGLSYADVVAACDAAMKEAILTNTAVGTEQLILLLDERRAAHAEAGGCG